MPTPASGSFDHFPPWGQSPGEGKMHMHSLPLSLGHGDMAQLGQLQDYFSLGMEQFLAGGSYFQPFADYNGMPKQ
jgi:hypothetical protein